LLKWPK